MKNVIAMLIAAPILTMFGGVGVLAFRIAGTWSEGNTNTLVGGLVAGCTGGGIVISLILAVFVALVFYSRWSQERNWQPRPARRYKALPSNSPPMITGPSQPQGGIVSGGLGAYEDLDGELFSGNVIDGEWS
ncbi:hypothetical protein KFU94_41725 [Chloroflexi bacterium TSY]|nr:hypothetical protein [Chloroflexi bacterium TSY]